MWHCELTSLHPCDAAAAPQQAQRDAQRSCISCCLLLARWRLQPLDERSHPPFCSITAAPQNGPRLPFSLQLSVSYVPSLLLSNFSPFFSSLFLIFHPVIFYASPAAAMNHDGAGLRACGAPQQAQCAECICPLVPPQKGPTVQPLLCANMSTSGGDIISS